MNPNLCTHPHEHQSVQVNKPLREIDHECGLCGAISTATLGSVATTKTLDDVWKELEVFL